LCLHITAQINDISCSQSIGEFLKTGGKIAEGKLLTGLK